MAVMLADRPPHKLSVDDLNRMLKRGVMPVALDLPPLAPATIF